MGVTLWLDGVILYKLEKMLGVLNRLCDSHGSRRLYPPTMSEKVQNHLGKTQIRLVLETKQLHFTHWPTEIEGKYPKWAVSLHDVNHVPAFPTNTLHWQLKTFGTHQEKFLSIPIFTSFKTTGMVSLHLINQLSFLHKKVKG